MLIVRPSIEVLARPAREEALALIERAARTCYKSESKSTADGCVSMVRHLIKHQHYAMLEHVCATMKVVCDRGVSHELVRHRVASYAQESTRYCNYGHSGSIVVVEPCFYKQGTYGYDVWEASCKNAERSYMQLLEAGSSPQEARTVLPNSLKTEIVVTMNLREWMHFFELRAIGTTGKPHPQMLEVATLLLKDLAEWLPEVFGQQYELLVQKSRR